MWILIKLDNYDELCTLNERTILGWWIDGYKQLADNNESSFHIEKHSYWQRFWILSKKELECNAYTVFPWFLPEFSRMRPYSHVHHECVCIMYKNLIDI